MDFVSKSDSLAVEDHLSFNSKKAIIFAAKFIPQCTCLVQASAYMILKPNNAAFRLIIGVKNSPNFASHAWVEDESGIVFGGVSENKDYKPILEILG